MRRAAVVITASEARNITRVCLGGIAGCAAAILGAVGVIWLGVWISAIDARQHIPGHAIQASLMVAPALIQLLYVVPLYKLARRRDVAGFAGGLIGGSVIVGLANAAALLVFYRMSQFD